MSELPMIKVAIADDEVLFRKGICLLLDDYEDIQVSLEAANGQDLLDQLSQLDELPDLVLLDLNMPELNGVDTAKILKSQYPDMNIIILSTHFSAGIIFSLIELGVASYLAKNTDPDLMAQTIREVKQHGFYYTPEIQKIIRDNIGTKRKQTSSVFNVNLTKRELEILQLICEQFTNAEIGKKLFISSRTVEGHRNKLLNKLDCRNSAGLVAYALQHDLVKLPPKHF